MRPTFRERVYAGAIMTVGIWALIMVVGYFIEEGSPAAKVLPMFLYSFVGLILAAAYRPRPFLDWVRKWTRGWPRLP